MTTAVCAAVTALLAVLVYHQNGAGFMDRKIDHLLHRSIGRHPGLLEPLARLGDQLPVTLMAIVLVVGCLLVRRWNGAVLVATTNAEPMVMGGRSMQGWLRVAPEHIRTKRQLAKWVQLGTTYARSLPAKR